MATVPGRQKHLRVHARYKIFELAQVRTAAGVARAHLLDISSGGAKLHCIAPIMPGSILVLTFATQHRSAEVVWSNGQRYGVKFRLPLSIEEMTAILPLLPHR